MAIRIHSWVLGLAALLAMAGCGEEQKGPIQVSAIGGPPRLENPNLKPLDAASAFLVQAAAEGLVRFDASGQIEPGLAQSWIVSDDGLRYTFRLTRQPWPDGSRITAQQVVARLRAAGSSASSNPVKPLLGAIDEITAMTDEVLEIGLKSPRPNFLQLLAQPELGIILRGQGAGPYRTAPQGDKTILLTPPPREEDEASAPIPPSIVLRGEPAALAIARFAQGEADLAVGGTVGDLPLARAATPGSRLVFDPAAGLFGLAFVRTEGPLADPEVRAALSMAVDRFDLVGALDIPGLEPSVSLVGPGVEELPQPAQPGWATNPMPMRRAFAARAIAAINGGEPLVLRVAMPDGPGYRLVFAHLRRDWAAIGVEARLVGMTGAADLRLVDAVAPVRLASWYLRYFLCEASPICDPAADEAMAAARIAPAGGARRALLANADRILSEAVPFIPIAAPVRWSLVSARLNGFRPNMFARHPAGELIAPSP